MNMKSFQNTADEMHCGSTNIGMYRGLLTKRRIYDSYDTGYVLVVSPKFLLIPLNFQTQYLHHHLYQVRQSFPFFNWIGNFRFCILGILIS